MIKKYIVYYLLIISVTIFAENNISIISGNYQSGKPGNILSYPLKVQVTDNNNPCSNKKVTFEIKDKKSNPYSEFMENNRQKIIVETNSDGIAETKVKLPLKIKTIYVDVSIPNKNVTFELTSIGQIINTLDLRKWSKNSIDKIVDNKIVSKIRSLKDLKDLYINNNEFQDNFTVKINYDLSNAKKAAFFLLSKDNYTVFVLSKKTNGIIVNVLEIANNKIIYNEKKEFQRHKGTLRFIYDKTGQCLHIYNSIIKNIDNKDMYGWYEFPTIALENIPHQIAISSNKNVSQTFSKSIIKQTPVFDIPDYNTGFKAVWRDYTFSGVTDSAIVVTFDPEKSGYSNQKFVFWRSANYIPWWHIDNKTAFTYEFVEIWGGGVKGCHEPMSDRLCRWSNVKIIENTPEKIIVHWHYVLANYEYKWWGGKQKPEVDEYYTFFPDGTGLRKITYHPAGTTRNELSELIVVNPGGMKPLEHISKNALTIFNLDGDVDEYTWNTKTKKAAPKLNPRTKYWNEIIFKVNFKDRLDPYEVFVQEPEHRKEKFPTYPIEIDTWEFEHAGFGGYEFEGNLNTFSHWPLSWRPYETPDWSAGKYLRTPTHTCLISINAGKYSPKTTSWEILIGLSNNKNNIINNVKKWLNYNDTPKHESVVSSNKNKRYFTHIKLPYNQDMISNSDDYSNGTGYDLPGDIFPDLKKTISSSKSDVTYKMIGAAQESNCYELKNEKIPINLSNVKSLYLLGLSHSNAGQTQIELTYKDKETPFKKKYNIKKQIYISDWWDPENTDPQENEKLFLKFDYHHESDGKKEPGVGLWSIKLKTDSDKFLKSINFSENNKYRIFAITAETTKKTIISETPQKSYNTGKTQKYIFVDLPYNQDMISSSDDYNNGTGWDLPGDAFPDFNKEIKSAKNNVPFKMTGASKSSNCYEMRGENITINQSNIKKIHLLGLTHSNAENTDITIIYQDGTSAKKNIYIPDWWDPVRYEPKNNEELAVTFDYHNEVDGKKDPGCGIWRIEIKTDPNKTIKSIKFPFNDKYRIFGITLER